MWEKNRNFAAQKMKVQINTTLFKMKNAYLFLGVIAM